MSIQDMAVPQYHALFAIPRVVKYMVLTVAGAHPVIQCSQAFIKSLCFGGLENKFGATHTKQAISSFACRYEQPVNLYGQYQYPPHIQCRLKTII